MHVPSSSRSPKPANFKSLNFGWCTGARRARTEAAEVECSGSVSLMQADAHKEHVPRSMCDGLASARIASGCLQEKKEGKRDVIDSRNRSPKRICASPTRSGHKLPTASPRLPMGAPASDEITPHRPICQQMPAHPPRPSIAMPRRGVFHIMKCDHSFEMKRSKGDTDWIARSMRRDAICR